MKSKAQMSKLIQHVPKHQGNYLNHIYFWHLDFELDLTFDIKNFFCSLLVLSPIEKMIKINYFHISGCFERA